MNRKASEYRFHWAMCTHMPALADVRGRGLDPAKSEAVLWIAENAQTTIKAAAAIFRSAMANGAIIEIGNLRQGNWRSLVNQNKAKWSSSVPSMSTQTRKGESAQTEEDEESKPKWDKELFMAHFKSETPVCLQPTS